MERSNIPTATAVEGTPSFFNKAKNKLSFKPKVKAHPIPSDGSINRVFDKVKTAINMMKYVRIIMTIILLSWLAIMSYFMITEIIKNDRIDIKQQEASGVSENSKPPELLKYDNKDDIKDINEQDCKHGDKCSYYKTNSYYKNTKEPVESTVDNSNKSNISSITQNTLSYENKNYKVQSLHYLQHAWFGDESIVYILFKIWSMAILILIGLPIVLQILNEIGIQTNSKELTNL